ncbi:hypothetical protein V8C86DRAFT_2873193 [Haematococcus lacustris]
MLHDTIQRQQTLASGPAEDYQRALEATRAQDYETATSAFESFLSREPQHAKAWVSFAQMQRKRLGCLGPSAADDACRSVLQRAMASAPDSGQVVQALGLLELRSGRPDLALPLLQAAVQKEPRLAPVLQWQAVREAAAGQAGQQHP